MNVVYHVLNHYKEYNKVKIITATTWPAKVKVWEENKKDFPEIKTDQFHIDILAARFVLTPEWFDVVVASNLFGDILSAPKFH